MSIKKDDDTSRWDNIARLKDIIIKSREMLTDAENDAKKSSITINGLSDVISKLSEFVVRLDLRQFRTKDNGKD